MGDCLKVPCQMCGKMAPRKRLILVHGMKIKGKLPRICAECNDKSEEQHRADFENELEFAKGNSNGS